MKFNLLGFLASAKSALILLVLILLASFVGEVFLPSAESKDLVFTSLWFNALLGLLVLNLIFCFFSRIWRRRITLVSSGLMVFHLSFISLCAGVIYDSLFFSMEQ